MFRFRAAIPGCMSARVINSRSRSNFKAVSLKLRFLLSAQQWHHSLRSVSLIVQHAFGRTKELEDNELFCLLIVRAHFLLPDGATPTPEYTKVK